MTLLSIIIPSYNEAATLPRIVDAAMAVELPCAREVIVVDDGSDDATPDVLKTMCTRRTLRVVRHDVNKGKGAAFRSGLQIARGDYLLIQDADLEYAPADYPALLAPLLAHNVDVVFGVRRPHAAMAAYRLNTLFNHLAGAIISYRAGRRISDPCVCYKVFRRELLVARQWLENDFGIDIELALALAAHPAVRYAEVPVSYMPRTYREGKKIGFRDALAAIRLLLRMHPEHEDIPGLVTETAPP